MNSFQLIQFFYNFQLIIFIDPLIDSWSTSLSIFSRSFCLMFNQFFKLIFDQLSYSTSF